ncbi:MAG: hypothetical protein WBD55_01050 [Dehalococcoidia bacterium]
MRPRSAALILAGAGVTLILAIAAACGGGGDGGSAGTPTSADGTTGPLSAYMDNLGQLLGDLLAGRIAAQEDNLTSITGASTLDQQVEAARGFFAQFRDAVGTFSRRLGESSPPPVLEKAHAELASATGGFLARLNELIDQLDAVADIAALNAVLDRYFPAAGVVGDACLSLLDVAAANNVDVKLNCTLTP